MATKKRSTKKRATTRAATTTSSSSVATPPGAIGRVHGEYFAEAAATEASDGNPTNHPLAGRSLLDPVSFQDLITLGVIDAPPTE